MTSCMSSQGHYDQQLVMRVTWFTMDCTGACKTALSVEVTRLCQAHEMSLGSLRGPDALALIQVAPLLKV